MGNLEEQLKNIAREQGAALVGIASRKRLADAPPSGDSGYLTYSVCGNCANVCWENCRDRIENRKLLARSGFVVLKANGKRAAVHDENDIIEVDTPFHSRVALLKKEYEAALIGEIPIEAINVNHLWDKAVLHELKKASSSSV